ncbi:MAG TPA: TonB-dependent receptor, partial [Novosphingobium sp.]
MNCSSRTSRAALFLLASTAITFPALAQAQGTPEGATDDNVIVVTAQRREERLQDVPISISALGAAKLENAQVQSFDDYAKLLPSVSFQSFGPGQSQIFFRGVSSGGDGLHIGPLPTSSMYVDEIPVTTIGGTVDFHVYDIARVEALAGPQGTLFGASSLSGVLRLITNKPEIGKTSGAIDLQVGKYGAGDFSGTAEGYINLPISDNAALRVVGFYDKQGGYIDNVPGTRTFTLDDAASDPNNLTNVTVNNSKLVKNDYNDTETWGGRAALKIDLDDNWTVTPQVIYQHQFSNGGYLFDPKVGDLKVKDFLPSTYKDEWWQAALTIQGKLSDWDVTYAGGYFKRKIDNRPDYSYYSVAYDTYGYYATFFQKPDGTFLDPTQSAILGDRYTKQTHELRVNSPTDKPFRLTAGLFLQVQTDKISADYQTKGISTALPSVWLTPFGNTDTVFLTRIRRTDRDYAMFAQAEWDIAPTFTVIAGVRGFIANNTLYGFSGTNSGSNLAACITGASIIAPTPCTNINKKNVEQGAIWRGGVKWQAT